MSYRRSPSGQRSLGVGVDGGVRWWLGEVDNIAGTYGSTGYYFHSGGSTTVSISPGGSPVASGTVSAYYGNPNTSAKLGGYLNVSTFSRSASSVVNLGLGGDIGVCCFLPNNRLAAINDITEGMPPNYTTNAATTSVRVYDTSKLKTIPLGNPELAVTLLWQSQLDSGGPSNNGYDTADQIKYLITGDDSNVYAWGSRQDTLWKIATETGTVAWKKLAAGLVGVDVDSSGNVYVASGTQIVKYNSSGVFQWARSGGSTYKTLAVDRGSGDVYVAAGAAVMKIATGGTLTWIRELTGVTFTGVGVDGGGNVYGYGFTTAGFHLVKWNSSGTIQYKKAFTLSSHTGSNYVAPSNLAVTPLGHVFFGMPQRPIAYANLWGVGDPTAIGTRVYFGYFSSTPPNGTYAMAQTGTYPTTLDTITIATSSLADTTPATTLTTVAADPFTSSSIGLATRVSLRQGAAFTHPEFMQRYRSATI